jgi:RNA polymerase sigma-70 factor (ECF subfamily)
MKGCAPRRNQPLTVQLSPAVSSEWIWSPDRVAHFGPLGILQLVTFDQVADEELVERFQAGEASAFSEIFRRHQPAVTRVVARMLGTIHRGQTATAELEDLVQDVFVQIYRSLESFRGQARLSTWVYRIAVNVVLMHRRSARSRPAFSHSEERPSIPAPGLGPEEELVQRKNVEALYRHLGQLSEKKRTVYILHEIEGLSPSEISKIVGAPILTVRTRLFYARRELLVSFGSDPYLSVLVQELDQEPQSAEAGQSSSRVRPTATDTSNDDLVVREKLS